MFKRDGRYGPFIACSDRNCGAILNLDGTPNTKTQQSGSTNAIREPTDNLIQGMCKSSAGSLGISQYLFPMMILFLL